MRLDKTQTLNGKRSLWPQRTLFTTVLGLHTQVNAFIQAPVSDYQRHQLLEAFGPYIIRLTRQQRGPTPFPRSPPQYIHDPPLPDNLPPNPNETWALTWRRKAQSLSSDRSISTCIICFFTGRYFAHCLCLSPKIFRGSVIRAHGYLHIVVIIIVFMQLKRWDEGTQTAGL